MTKKLLILVVFLSAISLQVFAQSVKGKVTSSADGTALPGVTVSVKGGSGAAMTDGDGNYSINTSSARTLVFTYVGYKTLEVAVANRSTVDVILDEDNTQLDEVVVTALGIERSKKSIGYAIQEVKGTALVEARENNLANAFTGKVAGLQVIRSGSGVGGSSKIVLRGNTSLTGSNQPLIIVDGIPMDNFIGGTTTDYWNQGPDMGNGLTDVNPDDIQSVSVLKGPSAAALYGSRAGNGVILITTKSGRKQPGLGITFNTSLASESIFIKPDIQTVFGQGSEGVFNAMSNGSWGPKIAGQEVTKWDDTKTNLSSYDNVGSFLQRGFNQNYGLSVQQQFGATSVYSSLNYLQDKGIIPGNKLERVNFSSRVTSAFGRENRWTTDVKLSYNNTAGFNRPITGRDRSSVFVLYMLPTTLDITDFSAATNNLGNMLWYPGAPGTQMNPYWTSLYNLNQDTRNRYIMNGSIKYAFTDWLDLEAKAGGDLYATGTDGKTYLGSSLANSYSTTKQSFSETNYSTMLKAFKDNVIGKLGGVITLGGNLMHQKYSSLGVNTGQLEVPNLFSPTNSVNNPTITASFSEKKINSIYGSLNLNYDGWLYADITARNDWSSAFIAANRSYFYPSFSVSYVLSDMLEKSGSSLPSWWTYAKLRGSYATVGNDMAPYLLVNGYTIGRDPLGTTVAAREDLLKNQDVRSELIKNLEFGAELKGFGNRLTVDFTWYKSNSTRQLLDIPMDPTSGFSKRKINAGNIENKGFELMANYDILTNPKSLSWSISGNYSQNRNKIIDIASELGVDEYLIGGIDNLFIRATTDGLYGDIYGTKFLRVTDKASSHYGKLLLDGNGLPQATSTSEKLGSQQAKALVGLTNSFRYKDFGLSFLVDARIGGEIFSNSNNALQQAGVAGVTVVNGERADMVVDGVFLSEGNYVVNTKSVSPQRYWTAVTSTGGNVGIGEANIYDATHVRLRNITLSYSLPKRFTGNVFQNAKASLACNNVWMIKSNLRGIDPESVFATGSNAVGMESGAFPTMRSFIVSLSFGF